jgi:Ribbon-helix-helix protein, copG family
MTDSVPLARFGWWQSIWYTYGMTKTTVYLPPELKRALTRLARERRCSEAELLREAVSRLAGEAQAPVPRLPLFRSTGPSIAEDVDRALEGFGRR